MVEFKLGSARRPSLSEFNYARPPAEGKKPDAAVLRFAVCRSPAALLWSRAGEALSARRRGQPPLWSRPPLFSTICRSGQEKAFPCVCQAFGRDRPEITPNTASLLTYLRSGHIQKETTLCIPSGSAQQINYCRGILRVQWFGYGS